MNRCPITYAFCDDEKYTKAALKLLSKSLIILHDFPYTPKELWIKASEMARKMSIQGVQPKLSVNLNVKNGIFEITETGGRFILKPPHDLYDEIPQNEDLTMRLAKIVGIEIPLHGMIYNKDGSLSYFIKRFDRKRNRKIAVEDFSQLLGSSRDDKYESSMEKVASVLDKHCTFPAIEKLKLFRLMIFNFLVGNEDMHLKNFSLIRHENKVELSPAYDLLSTTIAMKTKEESALPIGGRKSRLTRRNFLDYGSERLGLTDAVLSSEFVRFKKALKQWEELIDSSFLSEKYRDRYKNLINARWERLTND